MALRRRRIERVARDLLARHGVLTGPVNVKHIAEAEKLIVREGSLADGISGFIHQSGDRAIIGVNSDHSPARQRFTIAHELGHYLLHDVETWHVDRSLMAIRYRNEVSSQGTDIDEREANCFAAEILMPQEFLQRDLEGCEAGDLLDEDFVWDLAERYQVSPQAMQIRLLNLGYIDHQE